MSEKQISQNTPSVKQKQFAKLAEQISVWAEELGFQQVGITDTDVTAEKERLESWLDKGYHADMQWMRTHADLRLAPEKLLAQTQRVISVRMNYLPPNSEHIKVIKSPHKAYIARYTLGRDYHKLVRKRLAVLSKKIEDYASKNTLADIVSQRPFVDSAPVLERPLAQKAGLGWVGKHTLLINAEAGSWFFLGELYTNLPLPINSVIASDRCGSCEACLKICPTDAFPKPYQLDANRCISYLTIENKGPIPEEFRQPIGNRIFGCDDCQAICPWNKYAHTNQEKDFKPRHGLDDGDLLNLWQWDEKTYLEKTAGSALRRVGYQNWMRNLAVALGNMPQHSEVIRTLEKKRPEANDLVKDHIDWAINQQCDPSRRKIRKIKKKMLS